MLTIRTKKAVQTSLHTTETHKIEFRFKVNMLASEMRVIVDAYKIIESEDAPEQFELVPGGGSDRHLTYEQVNELLAPAEKITEPNDNPLLYFQALIASGIKITIVSEGYWRGQLKLTDFE